MVENVSAAIVDLLQRSASERTEFSRTTANDSLGVLTCAGTEQAAELFRHWRPADAAREVPPRMRFIRCDFTRNGCQSLTFYFDGDRDRTSSSGVLAALPIYGHALRSEIDGGTETTTYMDVRLLPAARIGASASTAAEQLGFSRNLVATIRDLVAPLLRLGWQQTLAITPTPPAVKLGISTPRLSDVVSLIAQHDCSGSRRLAATMRRCGGSLGYAGVKARASGEVSWRLYARPFGCRDLARTIESLL